MAPCIGTPESSTAFIREPSPDDEHPDLDTSNPVNLTRLAALLETGWTISRGRGPRSHDHCLWCRGPMSDNTEILVHTRHCYYNPVKADYYFSGAGGGIGSTITTETICGDEVTLSINHGACKNAWPVSCFLEWVSSEMDRESTRARGHRTSARFLRCPMCRGEFYSRGTAGLQYDFKQPPPHFVPAAWIRVVLFSPEYVQQRLRQQQVASGQGKAQRLILLDRQGVGELPLFGRNRKIFDEICDLEVDERNPDREPESCKEAGQEVPSKREQILFFPTWVLFDWGNNEFRMTPIPMTYRVTSEKKSEDNDKREVDLNALTQPSPADLVDEATSRGGLATAIRAYVSDDMASNGYPPLQELRAEARKYYRAQIRDSLIKFWAATDVRVKKAYKMEVSYFSRMLISMCMGIFKEEEEGKMLWKFSMQAAKEYQTQKPKSDTVQVMGAGAEQEEDLSLSSDSSSLDDED